MAKFRKKEGMEPLISTASLPDIVFMLLFFFMVSTVMREVDLLIKVDPPEAQELKKLENRSLVANVYIGRPVQEGIWGTSPRLQLNDAFADVDEVGPYVIGFREKLEEGLKSKLTTSLKVDNEVEMGIVTEVKQELRKASALKISYSARERMKKK